jgi:hypothetical protein
MAIKRIKLRLDTEANFIEANPLLANGEVSIAVLPDGRRRIKIGDGYTPWAELLYRGDEYDYQELFDAIDEAIQNQTGRVDILEGEYDALDSITQEIVEAQSRQGTRIEELTEKTQSHDEAIGTLHNTIAGYEPEFSVINSRLTVLEDPRLTDAIVTELQNKNSQQDNRLDQLDAVNEETRESLDTLDALNTALEQNITEAVYAVSGLEERVISVETSQGVYGNRFTQLENQAGIQQEQIERIKNSMSGDEGNYAGVQNQIEQVNESLQQEIGARGDKDSAHEVLLNNLGAAQTQEQINRIDADNALGGRIDQEIADRGDADTALDGRVDQEAVDRESGDTALQSGIDLEAEAREFSAGVLDSKIDQEAADRGDADTALGGRIDQEIADRTDADTELVERMSDNHALFQTHENDTDNPHGVTKAQVGLSEVDNTADIDKPVSTAQGLAIAEALSGANTYTDEQIAATVAGTLHFKGSVDTFADLPAEDNQRFDLWAVLDTGKGYYWFGDEWNILDFTVDMSHYYKRDETDTKLETKVDKVAGKGLSKNDFSDEYLQLLQATSGALKVFHDGVDYTADIYEDILVTRYMFRSDLSVTGSYLEMILDDVSFKLVSTSATNLRTEVKSAVPGTTVIATIRRNTFYNSAVEGQTIQDRVLNDTAYVIDSTIYVESNDYSIYELSIEDHWWEVNVWPTKNKSVTRISLERRM